MAKYQIFEFCYMGLPRGCNAITGTDEEESVDVVCFDGIMPLKSNDGKYYKVLYPRLNKLTADDKRDIEWNCGYSPSKGEYGSICSMFGSVKRITKREFDEIVESKHIPNKIKQIIYRN